MNRLNYQRKWAIGRILNIGCGDDPVNFGPSAVHFDIDTWDLPNFVQGDCHSLPFKCKEFDTAVLGDVLEHCLDPMVAVKEAARVAKRIVMTIPEATELPSIGQHIALGIKNRADSYRLQHNLFYVSDDDVILYHKKLSAKSGSGFVDGPPESVVAHDGHINRFDEITIKQLIENTGMGVVDYQFVPEVTWMNWLITTED
jgi:hypothetical protein